MRIGIVSEPLSERDPVVSGVERDLVARGYDVRVLTGRVPHDPGHDAPALRRACASLTHTATSTVSTLRQLSNVDVLYVCRPPATAYLAAAVLRLMRGIPSVVHLQDPTPETPLTRRSRTIYRMAASIAVTDPSTRDHLVAQGVDPAKVRLVYNWIDEELFRPVEADQAARETLGRKDRCIIMYAGEIDPFQNVAPAIRAAASVEHLRQVDLVFVGTGAEERRAQALTAELGANNVRFVGQREPAEMATLYASADYSFISQRDLPAFRGTIPPKLQAALSCGSPVVAAVSGHCADIVERSGAGFACPPEDWPALADRFLQAAAVPAQDRVAMAARAHESYQSRMSRKAGVDQLEAMLRAAAAGPRFGALTLSR